MTIEEKEILKEYIQRASSVLKLRRGDTVDISKFIDMTEEEQRLELVLFAKNRKVELLKERLELIKKINKIDNKLNNIKKVI